MAKDPTPTKPDAPSPALPAPKTLRLYNRSDRSYIHDGHRLAPRTFLDVPAELGAKWLRDFENDIVEAGVAQKELGGVASENAELKAKIAELEAKLKNVDKDVV